MLALAWPAGARAQELDAAVAALSKGYVYVDPSAEAAGEIDADALDEEVRDSGESIFIAVLPSSAAEGASINETLQALHDQAGITGTYVLVMGREFRAGSDGSSVATLANEADARASRRHPGDPQGLRRSSRRRG